MSKRKSTTLRVIHFIEIIAITSSCACTRPAPSEKTETAKDREASYIVCFQSTRAIPAQLFSIDEHGEKLSQETNSPEPISFPVFERNNRFVLFSQATEKNSTVILRLDRSDRKTHKVCEINGNAVTYDISRDGSKALVWSSPISKNDGKVFILEISSGTLWPINLSGTSLYHPYYTQNNELIMANIDVQDMPATVLVDLTAMRIKRVSWVPVGAFVCGIDKTSNQFLYWLPGTNPESGLWLAEISSKAKRKLRIPIEIVKYHPLTSFSPDGKIIFMSAGYPPKIFKYDLNEDSLHQLTFGKAMDFAPTVQLSSTK